MGEFKYGFFKVLISNEIGKPKLNIQSYFPTDEKTYNELTEKHKDIKPPANGIKYMIARFIGDPMTPKISSNHMGKVSYIPESVFKTHEELNSEIPELVETKPEKDKSLDALTKLLEELGEE